MKLKKTQILKILHCKSVAQAVNQFGLGNCDDLWPRLEAEAFCQLRIEARGRVLDRMLDLLRN